jgi:hypothetical protein
MMVPERVPRFIDCRECDAPDCRGCNIYRLAEALQQGKLDWMKDEKNSVRVPVMSRPFTVSAQTTIQEAGAFSNPVRSAEQIAEKILKDRMWKSLRENGDVLIDHYHNPFFDEDVLRATLFIVRREDYADA